MDPDDIYRSWKETRRRSAVPAGFADKVMGAVQAYEQGRQQGLLARWFVALASARLGRAGILGVALLLFALRLMAVIGVFLDSGTLPLE
jgi:hypothetical protein